MICKNYYYYYQRAFSSKFCEDIIKYGLKHETHRAKIGKNPHFNEKDKKQLKILKKKRDSHVVWMNDPWILREIRPWLVKVNEEAEWNFQWDNSQPFQFTQYEKGQYYGWHVDSTNIGDEEGKVRKLSLTLNLSKPQDYEGGELEFYFPREGSIKPSVKRCTEIKEQGSIVFFPSFLLHQVKPVTKGKRHSLVCWHVGNPFQ